MACHTTRNVKLVENPDATSRPSQIEVVTRSGATILVYDPVIQRDSLRGYSDRDGKTPTALAVSDIQSAKARQLSGGRTAALVLGLVAAAAAAWVLFIIVALSSADW